MLLLAFLAFVAVPFIIPRITSFIDESTGRNNISENGDTTPPSPPRLRDVPRYVNENSLEINGSTEPGAKVYVVINGKDEKLIASTSGTFNTTVQLPLKENEIFAFSEDEAGNKSTDSQTYIVTVDNEKPTLEIIKPKDGDIKFGQENYVEVEGQTEDAAHITINGRVAILNNEGKFNMRIGLNEGKNDIEIVAKDEASNETKIIITVSYSP